MIINFINIIVLTVATFILPQLIIRTFGSDSNGLVQSIKQFINWSILLRLGMLLATRAALFKPLAQKDFTAVSEIVLAMSNFMKRVAVIFSFLLLLLACLYPLTVIENFSWVFSFTMVIIIGLGAAVQYFLGITYQALLETDQKQYLISGINIFSTIIGTIFAVIAILLGAKIHVAMLITVFASTINPIFIFLYSNRHYKFVKDVKPNNDVLKQMREASAISFSVFASRSVGVVIVTIFLNVFEVSVYTTYFLVISGVQMLLTTVMQGIGVFFGDMLAKNEHQLIEKNLRLYELVVFGFVTFFCAVVFYQLTPFVSVYTKGVTDIDYFRPIFGYIACISAYFQCIRTPYQTIIETAGHFKQTRNGAIFEAIMCITISLVLVNLIGITGAVIGTLFAGIFRTFQYSIYLYKNIVKKKLYFFIKRLLLSLMSIGIIIAFSQLIKLPVSDNYLTWTINSCILSLIALSVVFFINFIFYRDETFMVCKKLKNALTKR